MSRRRRHVLCVEGNIGVGKSTALEGLKAKFGADPRVSFVEEDVAGWESRGLLKGLYDGTLHKGMFQACALMPQIIKLHKALQDPRVELVITERSPWSNFHVFAKSNLDWRDLNAYEYIFDGMIELFEPFELHAHIAFLDVPPEVSIERRVSRGRKSEENLLSDYIRELDESHRRFLSSTKQSLEGVDSTRKTFIPSGSKEEVVEKLGELALAVLGTGVLIMTDE